jgi:tRNA modification GTPase
MNGKMDLTRAESVMELVSAKTGKALEQAVRRLSGSLEKEIHAIRDLVLETAAAVERVLDYPEDELDDTEEGLPHRAEAEAALGRLRLLCSRWRRDRLYREGALAVIAGRPNAGKSSLFNALLGEDRSIVTSSPGATRDWIEGSLSLEGIPLRLADTAGLRDLPGAEPESAEAQGIRRSAELIAGADLILYVVDGGEGPSEEDEAFLRDHHTPLILVWNKSDLRKAPETAQKRFQTPPARRFAGLSAKTGSGLPGLHASILSLLEENSGGSALEAAPGAPGEDSAALGSRRQKEITEEAAAALEEALSMADRNESVDLIAPVLREALHALGEITGEISSACILEKMFSRFCLGK